MNLDVAVVVTMILYQNKRNTRPSAQLLEPHTVSMIKSLNSNRRFCSMKNLVFLVLSMQQLTSIHGFSSRLCLPSSKRSFATSPWFWKQHQPQKRSINLHDSKYSTCLFDARYGRGAEIWPPANEEPIRLENSFPSGILPDQIVDKISRLSVSAMGEGQEEGTLPDTVSTNGMNGSGGKKLRRTYVPRAIGRILRRAAYAQEETESEGTASSMDKTPIVLAAALVVFGMVRPLDALLVSFLTGYFIILFLWARSLRRDEITPVMPSLPPQGHVPNLVSNPLGPSFTTYSMNYDYWLKAGALLGLLAPVAIMLRYAATQQLDCARACARPIFFMCCQAVSEAVSRRSLTPLPIRILIPVAYNTVRLGYLWSWAFQPLRLGRLGRAIAVANLVYWATNLFGFLIPVATVRYMRAHFFAVEAEQVTTRSSMEDSAGLMF